MAQRLFSQDYLDFLKRFFTVVITIVILLALWRLREIVLLVFLSIIIAVTLSMPVVKLQSLGFRRSQAIAVAITLVVAFFILLSFLVLPPTIAQTSNLIEEMPEALDAAEKRYENFRQQNAQLRELLPAITSEQDMLIDADENEEQDFTRRLSSALPILTDAGNALLAIVVNVLLIMVVSLYILIAPLDYAEGTLMLVPPGYQQRFVQVVTELRRSLTAWLTALSFSISITFVMVYIGMSLWSIPNAMGLAAIAAIATVIPNLGAIIPIIPISIFTLSSAHPERLILVLGTYLLIQQVESALLSPMIVKRQMNIPVGAVLVFQLIAGTLFGFLGVLLAVPMLGVLITLVREIYVHDILGVRNIKLTLEENVAGELVMTAEVTPVEKEE